MKTYLYAFQRYLAKKKREKMKTYFYIVLPAKEGQPGKVLAVCGTNKWLIEGIHKIKERAEDMSWVFKQKFRYQPQLIRKLDADHCYSLLEEAGALEE